MKRLDVVPPNHDLLNEPIPLLNHGYIKYIAHMGDDLMPLSAARMSTGNPTGVDPAKDAGTRDYLWRHAHSTPFEMSVLQIEVQCPLFVRSEWHRHRTQSYNEASGRYMEMPDIQYMPESDRLQPQSLTNKQGSEGDLSPELRDEMLRRMNDEQRLVRENYEWYLEQGLAREVARINMPLSQYTRFRAQANLRNWFHFLNLRMAPNAQYEIRVYAHALAEIVRKLWPETWAVFEEHTLEAASFSKTEREVLSDLMAAAFADLLDAEREAKIAEIAGDRLSKGRLREFLGKLS
jgi:thymidylate synthase (FAD)